MLTSNRHKLSRLNPYYSDRTGCVLADSKECLTLTFLCLLLSFVLCYFLAHSLECAISFLGKSHYTVVPSEYILPSIDTIPHITLVDSIFYESGGTRPKCIKQSQKFSLAFYVTYLPTYFLIILDIYLVANPNQTIPDV